MKWMVLVLVLGLAAGVTAAQQDARLTIEPQNLLDGSVNLVLTNQSHVPITGVIIMCEEITPNGIGSSFHWVTLDSAVGSLRDTDILYKEAHTFLLFGPRSQPEEVHRDFKLKAVLFADGSSFGDPEWIDYILQLRRLQWQEIREALLLLEAAKRNNAAEELMLQELKEKRAAALQARRQQGLEKISRSDVYGTAIANLQVGSGGGETRPPTDRRLDLAIGAALEMRQRLFYARPPVVEPGEAITPPIEPPTSFEIRFPSNLKSEQVRIEYALVTTSAAGQPKETVLGDTGLEPGKHDVQIKTSFGGHRADGLELAIYVPGCQIKTFFVPSLASSSGSTEFVCQELLLPTLNFTGIIQPLELLGDEDCIVSVVLLVPSQRDKALHFSFRLARATPDREGIFRVEFPDFSLDPATHSSSTSGGLSFAAEGARPRSGFLTMLQPARNDLNEHGLLRLQSDYGGPVRFTARPNQ